MSQSKVMTDDGGERLNFKDRLNDKLGGLLTLTAAVVVPPKVLLLPEGHDGMHEAELLFTLTHNPELAHSRDSAIMAVNLLQGRAARPAHITFQVVKLANPVPVPEFVAEIPARRKASGVAPGFTRIKDSAPEREDKEALKKAQFKQSLKDGIDRKLAETPQIEKVQTRVLLLPEGHDGMTDAELQFTLVRNSQLMHTTESAALAVNILQGRAAKPDHVAFQVIELVDPVPVPDFLPTVRRKAAGPTRPVRADSERERKSYLDSVETLKKAQFKQSLKDGIDRKLAETPQIEKVQTRVLLVPSNYEELSDADLHFALVNNLELKHSHDSALLTIDVVKGRVRPPNTILQTVASAAPVPSQPKRAVKTPPVKARAQDVTTSPQEGAAGAVMLLPPNYRELSEGELGFVLTHSPELKHTPEGASFVLDVLFGRTEPLGVKFEVVDEFANKQGNFEALRRWYTEGGGADRIAWGTKGDFTRCMQLVGKYISPEDTGGFCQNRHMEIYGEPNATRDARENPKAALSPRVLLLPANYRDFSAPELHAILVDMPELDHSPESALLAVSIVTKMTEPNGFELRVSDVVAQRDGAGSS